MNGEEKPVAWRVKDYADGWTVYQYEHEAHRAARNGNLIEPLYTRAPINRPSPEAGESGKQPFERYPALASWIERLANTSMNLSLGDWMVFVGALNMTIERIEAELGEARKERDDLRWAIMGGEDAPGVLDTVTHDEVLKALQESRSNWKSYAEMVAAERDRLSAALGEAERAINRAKEAVEDQDDIELVGSLDAALSTLKTAREG